MQTLLLPAARPGGLSPSMATATPRTLLYSLGHNPSRYQLCHGGGYNQSLFPSLPSSLFPLAVSGSYSTTSFSSLISSIALNGEKRRLVLPPIASAPASAAFPDETEQAKLSQVAKRLKVTARYFKRLGSFGFWGQLICTLVAAVILSFSIVTTGKITSPLTFYSTAAGIAAAFISVFWSFGYLRLSERLQRTANDPSKAPPRADVVKGLKNGITVNLLGMGAAVLGMQATVGLLVAKALTSSATPYYQGISPGYSPVLALDIFLVQASANTILSHFLGLVSSLELLRSVTLPPAGSAPAPKIA